MPKPEERSSIVPQPTRKLVHPIKSRYRAAQGLVLGLNIIHSHILGRIPELRINVSST